MCKDGTPKSQESCVFENLSTMSHQPLSLDGVVQVTFGPRQTAFLSAFDIALFQGLFLFCAFCLDVLGEFQNSRNAFSVINA